MMIGEVSPQCTSPKYKKNGHIHNGKQNYRWHDCGRQGVHCFEQYLIAEDKRGLIERLLVERMSLRGMRRAAGAHARGYWGFSSRALKPCRIISTSNPARATASSSCDASRWQRMQWPALSRRRPPS